MTPFHEKQDKILQWLRAKGYTGTPQDAMYKYCKDNSSIAQGTFYDHLNSALGTSGYTGRNLDDNLTTMFIDRTGVTNRKDAERYFFSNTSLNMFSSNNDIYTYGLYPFNTDANDYSIAANHGTINGTASITSTNPKFGAGCLNLDGGASSNVSFGDSIDWDFPADFTISFWANYNGTSGNHSIIGNSNQASGADGWMIFATPNNISIQWMFSGTWAYTQGFAHGLSNDGLWHHHALVRYGSSVKYYVDGVSIHSGTNSTSITSSRALMVGQQPAGTAYNMTGKIDDLQISKVARFTSNFTPPTSALPTTPSVANDPSLTLNFNEMTALDSSFTFSRTSPAMMIGSDGNLTWAPTNLLTNSTMTGAVLGVIGSGGSLPTSWSVTSAAGITREVVAIGDDYVDLKMSGTNSSGGILYPHMRFGLALTNISLGQSYTVSCTCALIAGTVDNFRTNSGKLVVQWLNGGSYVSETGSSAGITSAETRIFTTGNCPSAGVTNCNAQMNLSIDDGVTVNVTIRFKQPQLEPTSPNSPLDYSISNSAAFYGPRFEYDPVTLVSKGILLEEQRTNIVPNTNSSAGWNLNLTTASTGGTVLGFTGIRITNSATGTALRYAATGTITGTMTAVTVYTMSMYVRIPAGSSLQYVQLVGSSGWADAVESYANFDIVNGTLGNSGSVVVDKGIEDHGNGVYRIWMALPTVAVPSAGSTSCIISFIGALTDARTVSTTFATTSYYVDVLCPQLELGYARTSAIPTTGVAATRSRDSLSIATGSWYDQTRGTLYLNFIAGENNGTTFRRYLCFNDASLNNVIELGRAGTSTGQSATAVGGSFSYAPTSGTHPAFTEGKMAFGWNNLSKRLCSNGAAVGTDTTAPVYSGITGLTIGGRYNASTNMANGHIKVLKYWPYNYYTSAQLVTLST